MAKIGNGMTMESLGGGPHKVARASLRVNVRSLSWMRFAWRISRNCAPWYVRLEAIVRAALRG